MEDAVAGVEIVQWGQEVIRLSRIAQHGDDQVTSSIYNALSNGLKSNMVRPGPQVISTASINHLLRLARAGMSAVTPRKSTV